ASHRCHVFIFFCFFFSSRRRHTRSYGDWSSDVCSSDLVSRRFDVELSQPQVALTVRGPQNLLAELKLDELAAYVNLRRNVEPGEIGRASCREGVWSAGWAWRLREKGEGTGRELWRCVVR